jgi:TetR/AcrR family transcriptional repressor of nem operon
MRYPAEETAARHGRIVKAASRLFLERGFENVSVSEVMKAARLTHGAFYAHFGSKEELNRPPLPTASRFGWGACSAALAGRVGNRILTAT